MKVYRVENPGLLGPYSDDSYGSATLRMRRDHNNGPIRLHPSPYVSMHVSMSKHPNYKCGFLSMRDLFKWFGGWLPGLIREGFHIAVVDDCAVKHGPDDVGQILFEDWRDNQP